MAKKPSKVKPAAAAAPETPAQQLAKVDELLKANKHVDALPFLRAVVEKEPGNLQAQHWLNWGLFTALIFKPNSEWAAEQRRTRDVVLALTEGTKPGGELTLPQRSRALALFYRALERLSSVKIRSDLDAAVADGREAALLRDVAEFKVVDQHAASLGWILDGREGRNPDEAYGKLVARVREFPGIRSRFKPLNLHPDFVGFTKALDDESYLTWLASRPKEPRPADPQRAKEIDEAFLLAAGFENHARRNLYFPDPEREGRVGRLLTLLHLGADVQAREYGGGTALHYAAGVGDAKAVQALVKAGISVEAKDEDGNTPLISTCEPNRAEGTAALLALGADPNAVDKHGSTALFSVAHPEVALALLDGKADVNRQNKHGMTPLHLRARMGNVDIVRLFLERGADPSVKDASGATPLDDALRQNHAEVAKLLGGGKKKGAIDVERLLAALRDDPKKILSLDFYEDKDTKRVESILSAVAMKGPDSWDELARACSLEHPGAVFAIAYLASLELKPDPKTQSFTKAPRFVLGNLSIKGDLQLSGPLLVTGNLSVTGILSDAGPDSVLAVAGNVRAAALDTDGDVVIGGHLEVDQLIYGHYNDHSLLVTGNMTAVALIEDDHDVRYMGNLRVKHHLPLGKYDRSDAKLKKIFVKEAFDKEGLSRHNLLDRVRAGKPVFLKS